MNRIGRWRWLRLYLAAGIVVCGTLPGANSAVAGESGQVPLARQAWDMAAAEGWIEGLRTVELIRSDLLSVRLDGGVTGALDPRKKEVAKVMGGPETLQKPDAFLVTSTTDRDFRHGVRPVAVGRASYEGRNCMDARNRWPLFANTIFWHDYFLYLPRPLKSGHTYTVQVETDRDHDRRLRYEATLEYDEKTTRTKVIKINQVGYSAMAKRRYAYLGWWAGDQGKVDYSGSTRFLVVNEATGDVVREGRIVLRKSDDANSGETVYEMEMSDLRPGRYHIRIPGLARSDPFCIGGAGVRELYYHTMRAFFHQRCGQEFRKPWTWVQKPACHTAIWESGNFVAGPGAIHHSPGNREEHAHYAPKRGERKQHFKGGYHDAADFDTFTYHLPATAQVLTAYEGHPDAFGDGDLDLPESGNGVPDVLDEAEWDVWNHHAEIYSEFTVRQTCGPAAMLYATLYAMEKEAGLIPESSKPDPLAR